MQERWKMMKQQNINTMCQKGKEDTKDGRDSLVNQSTAE